MPGMPIEGVKSAVACGQKCKEMKKEGCIAYVWGRTNERCILKKDIDKFVKIKTSDDWMTGFMSACDQSKKLYPTCFVNEHSSCCSILPILPLLLFLSMHTRKRMGYIYLDFFDTLVTSTYHYIDCYRGLDFIGGNMPGMPLTGIDTAATCKQKCKEKEKDGCIAFNWGMKDNKCILKKSIDTVAESGTWISGFLSDCNKSIKFFSKPLLIY